MKRFSKLIGFIVVFIAVMAAYCTVSFAEGEIYTFDLIPSMTSNNSPSGICNANDVWSGFNKYYAFDDKLDTKWASSSTTGWISYQFSTPKKVCEYTITGDFQASYVTQSPKSWTFEGSNDGVSWVEIDRRSNQISWTAAEKRSYLFVNDTSYLYYRLNFTANNGHTNAVAVTEVEMMEKTVPNINAPTNLAANPGDKKVDLTWTATTTSGSPIYYIIKRSATPGGLYTTITSNVTGTTYTDTTVTNGTTYYYVVSAVVNGTESPNSLEASATPTAPVITGNPGILEITMTNGQIKEYDLSATELDSFLTWYDSRSSGIGKSYYVLTKKINIKPFLSRKEYISLDKISSFEVNEYAE